MELIIALGMAAGVISLMITGSDLFRPVIDWIEDRLSDKSCADRAVVKLINCQFCVGFWASLCLAILYRPDILVFDAGFAGWYPIGIFLTAIVMSAISTATACLVYICSDVLGD